MPNDKSPSMQDDQALTVAYLSGHAAARSRPMRTLTSEELADCCGGCRTNSAIETWMRRAIDKFCEVNGIRLDAYGATPCATCGGSGEVRGWETIHGKRRAVVNNCPDCTHGVQASPRRLRPNEVIALISPLSNNSADHDIEFAQRVMDACGMGGSDGR